MHRPFSFCLTASAWLLAATMIAADPPISAPPALRFNFGPGPAATGWTQVSPETRFAKASSFGFEPGANIRRVENGAQGFSTSDKPFLFSAVLPEGNYDVTVTFGDDSSGSTNTVKAESRRLMLENVVTKPGEIVSRKFTVNVRTPQIPGVGAVKLKDRERGVLHWDDKLTLEFNGARPAVRSVEIVPATNAVTLFLLGDSTVTDQPKEPWNSWGQMLTRFFKPGVAIANHAESGESLKSSVGARRVAKVLASLRPGDFVFIQFGHNDQKDRSANALAAYRANLNRLVTEVEARDATPVLVTSMERSSGVEKDTLGDYPATVRAVAKAEEVPLIDLHAMSRTLYQALDPNLKAAFQDGTHHNAYGSYELAKCVVRGIRESKLPLVQYLDGSVPPFDPAQPDPLETFRVPPSAEASEVKPDGN